MHHHLRPVLLCAVLLIAAQGKAQVELMKAQDDTLLAFAKPILERPTTKKGTKLLMSWPVYNKISNRFIASYLFGAADASPSKAYFALDNSDGRMTFGYTLPVKREDEQIKALWSFAAKANVSEGFASVVNQDEGLQDDLGVSAKFTFIGNPAVNFKGAQADALDSLGNYKARMKRAELTRWMADDDKYRPLHTKQDTTERGKEYAAKAEKLADELKDELAEAIEDRPYYGSMWNWWVNAEVYYPVTGTKVLTADSATQVSSTERDTRPFTVKGQFVIAKKWARGQSVLFSGTVAAMNNNTALADELEKTPFNSWLTRSNGDTTQVAVVNSDEVYVVKDFKAFISPSVEFGVVGGPFPRIPCLRFRVSVQQYLKVGENAYTPTIWSFGVPLSLKDEEGDPKINIEPQVRLVNGEHSIGFSLGIPLIGNVE